MFVISLLVYEGTGLLVTVLFKYLLLSISKEAMFKLVIVFQLVFIICNKFSQQRVSSTSKSDARKSLITNLPENPSAGRQDPVCTQLMLVNVCRVCHF